MRRTFLLALLAALLLAPTAQAGTDPIEILRDCVDDGVLEGDYTPSELRKAQSELPTDADEYGDCRDVLSRAIADAATPRSSTSSDAGGNPQASSSGAGGGVPTLPSERTDSSRLSDSSPESGALPAPYTPADHAAVDRAVTDGAKPVDLTGRKVAPGVRLAADVGRNEIPGTIIAVLVLLSAATVAVAGPAIRRRVVARRQP